MRKRSSILYSMLCGLALLMLLVPIAGCQAEREEAGEAMDQGMDAMKDATEEVGEGMDEAGEALEEAADTVEEGMEEAGEAVEEAAETVKKKADAAGGD